MKLYLVTRRDLCPGQQAVQAAHALQEYNVHHAELARDWYSKSNTLAFLAVPDERALKLLWWKAQDAQSSVTAFHEPDRQGELTALAIGPEGRKLVRGLRLALEVPDAPAHGC